MAVQVFVAHDKILDDRLRGKECALVPNNILCAALLSPLLFYVPRLTNLVSLDLSCRQPLEEESLHPITISEVTTDFI